MLLSDILQGIEITRADIPLDTEVTGVWDDSRRVTPGSLFVAVVGYETDGHRYIASALEKGAAAVLCQTPPPVMYITLFFCSVPWIVRGPPKPPEPFSTRIARYFAILFSSSDLDNL